MQAEQSGDWRPSSGRNLILVVDDHKTNRAKMCGAAQLLGHATCEAADGAEALRVLATNSIDLVLLDILMPVMDGFQVLQTMKASMQFRSIPVIAVSTLEDEMASVVRTIELGADDILPKDFDPALFKARIAAGLGRKRNHDAQISRLGQANEAFEKSSLKSSLYGKILDALAASVFVVDQGRRLILANKAGEAMLANGHLIRLQNGRIETRRTFGRVSALREAIDQMLSGSFVGKARGIGVPLLANDEAKAAAYVLPVAGNDSRPTTAPDHCVIFVANRGNEPSMTVDILRTVFDLTIAEAGVAMSISTGLGPQQIADQLGVSIHTVRTHLKRTFSKTETADQTSLGALVNSLLPPV